MIKSQSEIQQLKTAINVNFKIVNKKLSKYEKEIALILKKINTEKIYMTYDQLSKDIDVKVTSYMDDD
ncbi:hypothetical protein A3K02_01100 [candidate division WS6 bacterium RIFOXYD1_FULL_33_8]|uniref:Uncharacterized protein n=2 Tax=Candidatus Dojkabacteria TaxID=74243 RepID=A0A0G0AVT5_9BACT|nr:MAG: hypothetical protein UR32_C0003G0037 [candidate division WS6 bacterium GW2011_GWE2_33_157]KKP44382.1 MAG: hypothetical protein UR34_C0003G0008 [candidate division WS6 bacterium GW2011_GWC1_33_20]KKP46012.1 MAG: hypothetical protein UR36_C0002G0054 [candidate division WS6 bacterium GW2011_GWF1_33_233]KKP55476.1 MAG: hypothetical protein UR47_C0001G0037 [candidate division WS6 bacterium GW2011_GWB1_33_6]KKP55556.1 MAG: hypothetical protein UR45_C0001G0038 [candidate division WS6 bacterium